MNDVYTCPVLGCYRVFNNVDSLVAHVAGAAPGDESHAQQRDSKDHRRQWYQDNCIDEEQLTLGNT